MTMNAEVLSLQSLADLERAIAAFALTAQEALVAMQRDFARRCAMLDRQEEQLEQEVVGWREAAQNSEDLEELASCLAASRHAFERLGDVRGWQMRVGECQREFSSAATGFDRLLDQTVPRCREHLRVKLDQLHAYGAVNLNTEMVAGRGAVIERDRVSAPPEMPGGFAPARVPEKLSEICLPQGFVWVPLAEVSKEGLGDVASADTFKKVPYSTMASGMERLVRDVLPRVHQDPHGIDRYSFQELDAAAQRSYEDGLQRIYEAFFCKDFIYLERQRGVERYDIINGRHRIRVALDLGWDAVPARAKDLNQ